MMNQASDLKYYESVQPASLAERLLVRARIRMYSDFMRSCAPGERTRILDVGVSDVINDGANILEQLYPHPACITAAGLGEGEDFRRAYPLVTYVQVDAGSSLPFADQSFEIAAANAVLEHVGSVDRQVEFLLELSRVAQQVFVTVPNRFFAVEHHTAIPILHFWRTSFRFACRLLQKQRWAEESELILMSATSLKRLAPSGLSVRAGYTGLSMGPFSSNLFLHMART